MRVLIVADSYLPRLGGAEVYAYKLGSFLQKNDHTVALLTTEEGSWIHDDEFPVHRVQFPVNPFIFFRSMLTYYQLVLQSDVVHAVYSHKLAFLGGILARLLGKKLVIAEQGRGILDLPGNDWLHRHIHEFYRSVSIKLAYRFIASCREFVDIAKRYTTEKKITYQPNSVDVDEFKPGERDYSLLPFQYTGQPLIFIVRRMVPKNGIQFLVEAAPRILARVPNAQIVHIGWGGLEEYLKKRAKELGVEQNFRFLGRIENAMLQQYLTLADVVVFPSTAEATSIACLESMALGKPIVASRVGGFPEMVNDGKNGYLVNLTDTEHSDYDAPMTLPEEKLNALADAIINLAQDSEKRLLFGAHSRERAVKEFSWQENIKKIIHWYTTAP
ncbi:glycosyltransferase family 4 protein [Patescibacteria group bacterium]|nr:glycosyltransferase family 4 protein [Patescibacteria group bacterium]